MVSCPMVFVVFQFAFIPEKFSIKATASKIEQLDFLDPPIL